LRRSTVTAVPEVLAGFDPNSTPHRYVLIGRGRSTQARLARLLESSSAFVSHLPTVGRPGSVRSGCESRP
jgi:hypothetical protein